MRQQNKRVFILVGAIFVLIIAVIAITIYALQPYYNGFRPAWIENDQSEEVINDLEEQPQQTEDSDAQEPPPQEQGDTGPFAVHEDFGFAVFSNDVADPRVLREDSAGNILVSEPDQSRVSLINPSGERRDLITGLNRPHGLALDGRNLYVAETGQVIGYDYVDGAASNPEVLLSLPAGGRHWTRTLGIGPDGDLYISLGSSCNICVEDDWRRNKILRYDMRTQELTTYARGMRNAVFFEWNENGELFATEMGRDWLGDDFPPDEFNRIVEGGDYGFPYCYGNRVTDPEFDNPERCEDTRAPAYNFNAHESPLGVDFLDGNAYVALHGSWNRTVPIGYEVIRLSGTSDYQERETIMSGFLQDDGSSIGRPAGVLVTSNNELLISDDKADAIYRLTPLE